MRNNWRLILNMAVIDILQSERSVCDIFKQRHHLSGDIAGELWFVEEDQLQRGQGLHHLGALMHQLTHYFERVLFP